MNSSKLSCMSLLPARMRVIESKMKELQCLQDFSHYVYGDFSRRPRAANSALLGLIWPNFKLVRDVIDVLVPASMKKIRSLMKALECSQHFTPLYRYGSYQLPWTPEF